MTTDADAVTDLVVKEKVAVVAPAATVMLVGTVATAVLLLESATSAPPAGAADVSVTVPCEELPPTTLAGLSESVESVVVPDEGGVVAPLLISNVRTEDHVPFVPPLLRPRTRHQ